MRQEQFVRFVQQICYLLKLSQPCSKTALQYFLQFKNYEGHKFDQQILIASCIYLSVKIFEQQVRIRDILNMIYVLTSLYKSSKGKQPQVAKHNTTNEIELKESQQQKSKQQQNANHKMQQQDLEQQQGYILLGNIQSQENIDEVIQPHYSLSDYNQYKGKIIEAEQTLLRILGFSFHLATQNKKQLKRLLVMAHHMRMPATMAETVVKVYNDIHYIDINFWAEGVVYFAFLTMRQFMEQSQEKKEEENLQLKEARSSSSHQKRLERQQKQESRLRQYIQLMKQPKKWEFLFCTQIKDLQSYCEKLANFYTGINVTP